MSSKPLRAVPPETVVHEHIVGIRWRERSDPDPDPDRDRRRVSSGTGNRFRSPSSKPIRRHCHPDCCSRGHWTIPIGCEYVEIVIGSASKIAPSTVSRGSPAGSTRIPCPLIIVLSQLIDPSRQRTHQANRFVHITPESGFGADIRISGRTDRSSNHCLYSEDRVRSVALDQCPLQKRSIRPSRLMSHADN